MTAADLIGVLPPAGTAAGEIARALPMAAAYVVVFLIAELWTRIARPPAEWTRKLVHVGGGVIALVLPWVFRSHWTVLALGALSILGLRFASKLGLLTSLHRVERFSRGELYFPIAVYLTFVVARHEPVYYMISLFMLVIADALAAVLGTQYGRLGYRVETDRKTLEGSAVFFLAAFLGAHLPLLLGTPIDRGTSVIVAFQLALLVTSFEAISLGGIDNLVLPLATFYLLHKLAPKPIESTGLQLAIQLMILALMLLLARRTGFLTFSGAVAAHLVLYGAFSLGGPTWIVAPALALAAFIALDAAMSRAHRLPRGGYQVRAIFYASVVAMLVIFADNTLATAGRFSYRLAVAHPFGGPFVGALAAPVAILAYQALAALPRVRRRPALQRAMIAAAIGILAVVPLGLWTIVRPIEIEALAAAIAIGLGGFTLYLGARRWLPRPPGSVWDLRLIGICVLAATLIVTPLHLRWLGAAAPGASPP